MHTRGLDICDPKSIVRIATSKQAARASPGGNGNGLSYGTAAIDAYLKRGDGGNT
jgi:hypothetical protein